LVIWCIWFAFWLAITVPYLVHRSRELAQMERAWDAMTDED
jgi:hypothetical protein